MERRPREVPVLPGMQESLPKRGEKCSLEEIKGGKEQRRRREREWDDRVLVGERAREVIRSPTAASLPRIYRSFAGLCSQFVCAYDAETHVNLSRASAPCELLLLYWAFSTSPAFPQPRITFLHIWEFSFLSFFFFFLLLPPLLARLLPGPFTAS